MLSAVLHEAVKAGLLCNGDMIRIDNGRVMWSNTGGGCWEEMETE